MYPVFRKALFKLDPESAHALALGAIGLAGSIAPIRWMLRLAYRAPARPVTAFGLNFKNPIGLAAGYDKDGRAVRGLAALGFGHVEVGTVTPLAQPGNSRPRMFRLEEDQAIINRLGFPSRGSAYVQRRLTGGVRENWLAEIVGVPRATTLVNDPRLLRRQAGCILGVNIGRNAGTSNEDAVMDYLALLQNFAGLADYISINVSSPNTPGLRALQAGAALEALLIQLHAQRRIEQDRIKRRLPLLVKLSPDLSEADLEAALDAILRTHIDGVIVTNTTTARDGLSSRLAVEQGGLSGAPLRPRSEAVLQHTARHLAGRIAIVSAGGILSADDVQRRLDMGAALVQLYTGLIYWGPGLVREALASRRT